MPRQARKKSSSGIYHIMLRGINKQPIFKENEDKERFYNSLKRYKKISDFELYAYCFMDNHVHLLIKEKTEPVAVIVKRISSSYVYWFNWNYERIGHLFQERFNSEAVEDDAYFLTVLRYIHQNPVKARITNNMSDFKWSSFNEYISVPKITDIYFALNTFSMDREKAIVLFKEFMYEHNDDCCLDIVEKTRASDDEVRAMLLQLSITDVKQLFKLEKQKRYDIVRNLKSIEGVTIRQLSRITGIPKSTIDKV